jgi:glutathione S-transferase
MPTDVSTPVSRRDCRGVGAACGCGAASAELRARVAAIEYRLAPSTLRREDRAALERILPAIAGALGSEYFLASEAIASANPALVLVLAGMNARRLGKLLRRGDGVPVAGYAVHARGMEAGAVLWEVLRVPLT